MILTQQDQMLISVWTGEMYRAVTAQRRGQWHGRSVINAVMTVHTTCVITDQCHTFQLYHSTPLSYTTHGWQGKYMSVYLSVWCWVMVKNFHSFFWFTNILIYFHEYTHFVCCLLLCWSEEKDFLAYMWFLDTLVQD